jgi:hypothetical protein
LPSAALTTEALFVPPADVGLERLIDDQGLRPVPTVPTAGGSPPPPPVPSEPSSPQPANSATGIALTGNLTWSGCTTATAFGVIGPSTSPSLSGATDHSSLTTPSHSYSGLATSTVYYWQPYCSNASGDNAGKAGGTPIYSFTTTGGAAAGVVALSNLSIAGCFLTYGTDTGTLTTDYPVAMRKVGSARRYLQISGNGNVYESDEPTLKACSTAVASLNVGAYKGTWGTIAVQGSQQTPGNGGVIRGAFVDPISSKLVIGWSGQYTNLPDGINTLAVYSMTGNPDLATQALALDGCFAYPHPMPYTSGGVVPIPASFVSTYLPAGARWGLTGGLFASATSGNLYGPSLEAVVPPTTNACAAGVDNLQSAGTVLARFVANTTGPHCTNGTSSGPNLGCTPSTAPTNPHPAYMSFTDYSYDLYTSDWDPYGSPKVGYYADYVSWRLGLYDDGVKAAGIAPFTASEGWITTTISASPAPTMTGTGSVGSTGTMRLGSTSTNDGLNLNVGDFLGVNLCVRDVDAGCISENQKYLGIGQVTSVNTTTHDVAFTVVSPSGCTDCVNIPQVGGPVYGGPIYVSAIPGWMRSTLRLQLIDLAQWAAVIGGAAPYTPTYNEETSLYAMGVTTLGDPSAGQGIRAGFTVGSAQTVTSVVTDPANQQFVIFIKTAQGTDVPRSLGIVMNVSHTP